jgi:hypothetical protein
MDAQRLKSRTRIRIGALAIEAVHIEVAGLDSVEGAGEGAFT